MDTATAADLASEPEEPVAAGARVEIRMRLLESRDRARGLPAETAAVPYEARVRGTLEAPAALGAPATVRTATGRRLTGTLERVGPADTHTFGRPHPAYVEMVARLREERP